MTQPPFFIGWDDHTKNRGVVYLHGIHFINLYHEHPSMVMPGKGDVVFNRDGLAIALDLPPFHHCHTVEEGMAILMRWYVDSEIHNRFEMWLENQTPYLDEDEEFDPKHPLNG